MWRLSWAALFAVCAVVGIVFRWFDREGGNAFLFWTGAQITVVAFLVEVVERLAGWRFRKLARERQKEAGEGQPTCSLERYKTKPPYRQGTTIEIPISILSRKADVIGKFRLVCEPEGHGKWQRGYTFFSDLRDIGGELGESTPIPAGEPVVGTAAFRLEAEYFTGVDLWLDLQYGTANPLHIDRSEFCVRDT